MFGHIFPNYLAPWCVRPNFTHTDSSDRFHRSRITRCHCGYYKFGAAVRGIPCNAVAAEYLQRTLTATQTCSNHSGTALCETYIAGQRDLDVY